MRLALNASKRRYSRCFGIWFWIAVSSLVADAQLPKECVVPPSIEDAIRTAPSSNSYGVAGGWLAEKGNPPCAVASFEHAVQIDPQSAESHYNLALALSQQRQVGQAISQFQLAIELKPDMVVARNALAATFQSLARNEEAESQFREVLKIAPDSEYAVSHLAQLLSSERRYTAAISYWRQVLVLHPGSPDATVSIAIALYQNGQRNEAISALTSLIGTQPDIKSAHFSLAGIYAHEKRFQDAANEYTRVLALDPQDDEALIQKVKALIRALDYKSARGPAEDYSRRRPLDAQGHFLLGVIYGELGDKVKAEDELALELVQTPDDAQALYDLGRVLLEDDKAKQALPHFEKAFALDPSNASVQYKLAQVLRALGYTERSEKILEQFKKSKEPDSAPQTNEANGYLKQGEPAKAIEVYRQILSRNPLDARTEYNLALALGQLGDHDQQRQALIRATTLDPAMATPNFALGQLELDEGNLDSAKKLFGLALETDPQLASAKDALGIVSIMQGDKPRAEALFRQAIEDSPSYAKTHADLGDLLAQEGKDREAEKELNLALAASPSDVRVLLIVGNVKKRLGEESDAVEILRSAVKAAPNAVDAHLQLATALAEIYDMAGALAETTEAIRLSSKSALSHFQRGKILYYLRRLAEAQADLDVASRLEPQMAEPRYILALIAKQKGDYHEAIVRLREVLKFQPRNVSALYLLGVCLEHESEQLEAIAAWREAITLHPNDAQSLHKLALASHSTEPTDAARLDASALEQQNDMHPLDKAKTLAVDAIASMRMDDWPDAVAGLTEAIHVCSHCAMEADLHKYMGFVRCDLGDLENGERELRLADALKPNDHQIDHALDLVAQVRKAHMPWQINGNAP